MENEPTYLERRYALGCEAERCESTSRFMLMSIPLYILFPVLLIAVIPVFILIRRQRYLCHLQIANIREKACKELSGKTLSAPTPEHYSRLVSGSSSRRS